MGHRGSWASHLPNVDEILDEAWEEHPDRLCVPRQLAVLLNYRADHLCADFDAVLGTAWRAVGVTCREMEVWLRDKGLPFHYWADCTHFVFEPEGEEA